MTQKTYKLRIVVENLPDWKDKPVWNFISIMDAISFLDANFHLPEWEKDRIRKNDATKENGSLACTSWYELEKGEHQMTAYTSW